MHHAASGCQVLEPVLPMQHACDRPAGGGDALQFGRAQVLEQQGASGSHAPGLLCTSMQEMLSMAVEMLGTRGLMRHAEAKLK